MQAWQLLAVHGINQKTGKARTVAVPSVKGTALVMLYCRNVGARALRGMLSAPRNFSTSAQRMDSAPTHERGPIRALECRGTVGTKFRATAALPRTSSNSFQFTRWCAHKKVLHNLGVVNGSRHVHRERGEGKSST